MMPLYETLESRFLWKSQWYNLRQDRLRTPDGYEFTYTLVDHPGAVWVVPITTEGQVVLVWNYRHAVADWCYEVPAGGLPPSDSRLDQSQRLVQSGRQPRPVLQPS